MITIKISDDSFPLWPLIRQTSGGKGIWKDCKFIVNEKVDECDFWVVYGDIKDVESTKCPPENTVFITTEPEPIRQYQQRFLDQFAALITFRTDLVHQNIITNQPGLPWHVGKIQLDKKKFAFNQHYDYDYLKAVVNVPKAKEISVISSSKTISEGHRKRYQFVKNLQEHFGERLDVYGQGLNDVPDKWDAIAPYKYHIVLENSSYTNYWTEKIADTYLACTYPIYYGCPNLYDYFQPFTSIDINKPDEAIDKIKECINNSAYEQSVDAIMQARNLMLDKYNLFSLLSEYATKHTYNKQKQTVKLYPDKYSKDDIRSKLIRTFY